MGSPVPLIMIFTAYVWFVLSVGPRLMRDRKPVKLNSFIRAYNILQIIACTFFVKWSINHGVNYRSTWCCSQNKIDYHSILELCTTTWYFMILRLIELLETVIFVLRKKQNQITVLHVYHHISTVVLLWVFLKYSPSKLKKVCVSFQLSCWIKQLQ